MTMTDSPTIQAPAAGPRSPNDRGWRRAWRWTTGLLCVAFMVGAIIVAWPQSLGGQFRMVVVSGTSMEPGYHTGDMLLAIKSRNYEPGDVIVYSPQIDGVTVGRVVHRVIEVQDNGTYLTQGDNKDYRDPWSIPKTWVEGRVITLVPQGFIVIYVLRNPIFLAVMSGLLLTMALWPRDPLSDPPSGPAFDDLAPPV
ncbi:MAG: signal peptidase I [Candidatus Nanopelagicales bacterium]|jgi:signal peptidase I|nr:signal peptidase I [Candidatus Nanopelagicales bacterium]MCU0297403.1 signal peptidase I [Candidatus Nanopelagicales bacterium]